jgi:hypothetical protein
VTTIKTSSAIRQAHGPERKVEALHGLENLIVQGGESIVVSRGRSFGGSAEYFLSFDGVL